MGAKRCTIKAPVPSLFLPFLLLLHNQFSLFFAATDILTAGQCIRDGSNQTLVSHGGIFELGFFSPGQSKNRYVGTWYHGLPTQTIVWVANRANPVTDSSGMLCLVTDGDLVLIDHRNATIWSTNIRPKSNSVIAMLSDSGNLVLFLQKNKEFYQQFTLWESFDDPSDTYLPGMRTGLDLTTGTNKLFTSWKSENDPSTGNYSIGVDPRGLAQMFIWEGSIPRWRSGLWNGQSFLGIPMVLPLNLYGFKLNDVVIEKKMYFSYVPFNFSITRFVIRPNGAYEQMSWDENQEWNSTLFSPGNECEAYNKCGDYAICNDKDAIICSCLPGFEPKVIGNWSNGDWSGGCVRSNPLHCDEKEDIFVKVEDVKLPDSSIWIGNIDKEACEKKCLRNCSCEAYSYANGIGCLVWGDALTDIQQFVSGGEGIHVRVVNMSGMLSYVVILLVFC